MSFVAWLALVLLMALLAAASLHGLAVSGQFPREHRGEAFRSPLGAVTLFGSIAVTLLSLLVGLFLAWRTIPWYAAVIGGGVPILFAPLMLRPMPDRFVNGRGAVLSFSVLSAVIALAMLRL